MLTRLPPDQLAAFLERHPDLARRLAANTMPPVGTLPPGPKAALAAVLAASHDLPPKQRIAAVRAYFASLAPDQSRQLALLVPGVVGNLDGAPLPDRMAANRVQIAVALDDELTERAAIDAGVARMGGLQQWWAQANHGGWVDYVARFDDPQSAIAEMWGPIDPGTRHIAVFVPGTPDSTVIGHSYGGATVGVADREGLEADRIVMIESAGAGRGVFSMGDYHESETGRHIDHYTMTAPATSSGCPIKHLDPPSTTQGSGMAATRRRCPGSRFWTPATSTTTAPGTGRGGRGATLMSGSSTTARRRGATCSRS
jgi:hypothetical protein